MQNFSIENKYDVICKLGNGSQGMVYKVKNKQTNKIVAVKIQNGISQREYEILKMIMLKKFNHIIEIIKIEQQNNGQTLIEMELGEQSFYDFMQSNEFKTLTHGKKNEYFIQMLEAVKEFHETDSFHRDLKPENFVLCRGQLKLIDFGISKENQNFNQTKQVGTCFYMAPEVHEGSNYNKLIDIWALGCIWFEILTGNTFFNGNSQTEVRQQVLNFNQSKINDRINKAPQLLPQEKEILQKSLQIVPSNRLQIIDFINQLKNLLNPQQQQTVQVFPFSGVQSNQLPLNPNQLLQHNQCVPNQVPIVFQKLQVNQNNFGIIFPNQNPLIQQPQPQNSFYQQQQLKNQGLDQKKPIQIQICNPPFQKFQNQVQNIQQNQPLLNLQQKQVEVNEEDIIDNIQQQESQDLIFQQNIKQEYEIKLQEELAKIQEKEKVEYQIKLEANIQQQQKEIMQFKDQFQTELNKVFVQKEFQIKLDERKLRFSNNIKNYQEFLEKFQEYFMKIQTNIQNSDLQRNWLTKTFEFIKEIQLELEEQQNITKKMEQSISQFLIDEELQQQQELFTNIGQKFLTSLLIKLKTNDEEIRKLFIDVKSENQHLLIELDVIVNGLQQNLKQETSSLEEKMINLNSEIKELEDQFQKQNLFNFSLKIIKLKGDQNNSQIKLQEIIANLKTQSKQTIIQNINNLILMSQKVTQIKQSLDQTEFLINEIKGFQVIVSQLMNIDSKNKSDYQFYEKIIQKNQSFQIQYSKNEDFKNLPKLFEQSENLIQQDIDIQMLQISCETQFRIMEILSKFSQQLCLEQQVIQYISNIEKKKKKFLEKSNKKVDQLKRLHINQNCEELQETTIQLENLVQQLNKNQISDQKQISEQLIEQQYKDLKNKSNTLLFQQIVEIDNFFHNQSKLNSQEFNQKGLLLKYFEKVIIRPKKITIYFDQITKFYLCLIEIHEEYQVTQKRLEQDIYNYHYTIKEEYAVQLFKSIKQSLDQIYKQIKIFSDFIQKIKQFLKNFQENQLNNIPKNNLEVFLNNQNNLNQCENLKQIINNIPLETFTEIFKQSKQSQSLYYLLQYQIIQNQNFLLIQLINKKDIIQQLISQKKSSQMIRNQFEQFQQESSNLISKIFCSQNDKIKDNFDQAESFIEDNELKIIQNDDCIKKLGQQFFRITESLTIKNSLEKRLRNLFFWRLQIELKQ